MIQEILKNYNSNGGEFLKSETPSPKPARIPPQTPPAGGKSAEVLPNPFPQKIVLAKPSPHFVPPHCQNTWRAEPRKKNTLSFFKRKFTPAKSEMQGVFFLSGLPRLCEAVIGGAIHSSSGLVSKKVRILYNEYREYKIAPARVHILFAEDE